MARIPAEVWQFCVKQIKLYPIYKKRWKEEWANAEINYLHGGGNRALDPTGGGLLTGNTSPTERRYEKLEKKQEEFLERQDLMYYKRCIDCMHAAMTGMEQDERAVLDAVWDKGWRYSDVLADEVASSKAAVNRAKHVIIERLAIAWGMWF